MYIHIFSQQMASSSLPSGCQMTYYEMSLLQTEMQLDEVHDQLTLPKKNRDLIETIYVMMLREERELDAKARRFKKNL